MSNDETAEGRSGTFTVSVADLSRAARCVPETIRNAIAAGQLEAEKRPGRGNGGEWAISQESASRWLESRDAIKHRADAAVSEYGTLARLYKARRIRAWMELGRLASESLDVYRSLTADRGDPSEASALDASVESALRDLSDAFAFVRTLRSELNESFASAAEARSEQKAAEHVEKVPA